MNKKLFSSTGLILLAVISVLAIGVFNQLGKYVRIDLTENKLHTISDGSKNIVTSLEKPIELNFFFSNEQTKNIPELRNYARRVEDLLNEYVLLGGGKVKLNTIDPEPFSEDEDKAAAFGLQAIPVAAAGDSIYFGLAAANEAGDQEVIEFFHPEKEEFLEYEVSQIIYRLSDPDPVVVGLMSSLPLQGGFNMAARAPTPPWMIMNYIEEMYEVRTVNESAEAIEDDIDVLMLVHPKSLSEQAEYAIDQFVLRGGRLMVFVDPVAEMDQGNGIMGVSEEQDSKLPKLFKQWGVELVEGQVLGDAKHAMQVNAGGYRPVTHLGLLNYGVDNLAADSIVANKLQAINLASTGVIKRLEDSTTEFMPLISSSDVTMLLDAEKFQMLRDPSILFDEFKPTGEIFTVAAQLSGTVSSAFPDGKPAKPDESEENEIADSDSSSENEDSIEDSTEDSVESTTDPIKSSDEHLSKSSSPINVIIFADTDILSDRLWVRIQEFFGQRIPVPWANNAELISNALDTLSGSSDLISVRSRGRYSRPFTLVQTLQKEAETSFREKEKELQSRLTETETKLSELQRPPEEGSQMLTLSPEQEKAILSFQDEKLKIRKQLRDVRHQLDKDIKGLGQTLKFVNIIIVPLVITLLALLFSWRRRQQRRFPLA